MLTSKTQDPLSSKFPNNGIHTSLNVGGDKLLVLILQRVFDYDKIPTDTKPEEVFIPYIYLP